MISQNRWPYSDYDSMVRFYGEPNTNLTKLNLPFPLRLAWGSRTRVNRITVHSKVAASMRRALSDILEVYGYEEIVRLKIDQWGGCLSVRPKRNGSGASIHSWAAANDWWPEENGIYTPFNKSGFSRAVYIPMFNAWIREGWNPIGLTWGKDAMHIEATHNDAKIIQRGDPRFVYPMA